MLLELFPSVVAFAIWAPVLANRQVTLWLDNHAVVQLINNNSASCPKVLALLRRLVRCQLEGNTAVRARHVAGVCNEIADALSRFQWARFRTLAQNGRDRPRGPMGTSAPSLMSKLEDRALAPWTLAKYRKCWATVHAVMRVGLPIRNGEGSPLERFILWAFDTEIGRAQSELQSQR